MKNGKEVRSEGRINISQRDGEHILEIADASSEDHGIYQLEVRHNDKRVLSVASLVVLGRIILMLVIFLY